MTRIDELLRRNGACLLLLLLGLATIPVSSAMAQDPDMQRRLDAGRPDDGREGEGLFRVQRIEISMFGSFIGGTTYLQLPAPLTPLTNDTGAQDILDYSGEIPNPEVIAPTKKLEPGWQAGLGTTFYLTPNFGVTLSGSIGQATAIFTGQEIFIEPDPDDPLGQAEIEVVQPRSEIDRATVTTWTGTAGIIYHILAERKHNTRPFVTLGIGGILNQFPDTGDVGALTWNVGLGLGFPVYGPFRGYISTGLRFFVWETDEVDLDETLVFPEISAGLVWRHFVPEDAEEEVAPPLPVSGSAPATGGR